jgi:6-pyruvoyltetrahydropterin/6-carboxytetrahydropterin synthase
MSYEISVVDYFSAAHQIKEAGGKCEHLHGHNWQVTVYLKAEDTDNNGLVLDFRMLKNELRTCLDKLDHKYINDIPFFKDRNATSENICFFIYQELSKPLNDKRVKVSRVKVAESHNSFAEYTND